MLRDLTGGILAGIMISLGGGVFLACESRYVGALLFAMALMCICMKGYYLFTGKVCYLPGSHKKAEVSLVLVCLLGNLIATVVMGLLVRAALPALGETANTICTAKLGQTPLQTVLRGVFCGMLVYLSVDIYKQKNTVLAIILCIPAFILSGYEHSIADMFYFAASGIVSLRAFSFIWLVIVGNVIGGCLIPVLEGVLRREVRV